MKLVVFCVSLLLVAVDAAAVPPSIETDGDGNVLVTMPASANLKVIKVDEVTGERTEGE